MARAWLSIQVDLVSGRGGDYWPRPGRVFAASRAHRFSQLADAIDTAFARWDRSHLYKFELGDGRVIGRPEFDDFDLGLLDAARQSCRRCRWVSNSSTSLISATAGHICARWDPNGSIRKPNWGLCRGPHSPIGGGAIFPTSTVAGGPTMTAKATIRQTLD